jgi:hypothetical protein
LKVSRPDAETMVVRDVSLFPFAFAAVCATAGMAFAGLAFAEGDASRRA